MAALRRKATWFLQRAELHGGDAGVSSENDEADVDETETVCDNPEGVANQFLDVSIIPVFLEKVCGLTIDFALWTSCVEDVKHHKQGVAAQPQPQPRAFASAFSRASTPSLSRAMSQSDSLNDSRMTSEGSHSQCGSSEREQSFQKQLLEVTARLEECQRDPWLWLQPKIFLV